MEVFLGGRRRVREYAAYHNFLSFHAQFHAYPGKFIIGRLGGTRRRQAQDHGEASKHFHG
jgi:hypothetical protein